MDVASFLFKNFRFRQFICLYLFDNEGDVTYTVIQLVKSKESVTKTSELKTTDLDQVLEFCRQSSLPVIMVLDGDHVMSSEGKIPHNEEVRIHQQSWGDGLYSSYYRLDYLNRCMEHLDEIKDRVIACYGGIATALKMVDILEDQSLTETVVGSWQINATEKSFRLTQNSGEYMLDGDRIGSHQLMCFAAFVAFLEELNDADANHGILKDHLSEISGHVFYRRMVIVAPVVLFMMLLVNAMIYWNEYDRNVQLTGAVGASKNLVKEYDEHFEKYESLSLIAKASEGDQLMAVRIDQLTGLVPKGLSFTKVEINPVIEDRKSRSIDFEHNKLRIFGNVLDIGAYSLWIDQLDRLPWVASVTNFGVERSTQSELINFEIQIEVQ